MLRDAFDAALKKTARYDTAGSEGECDCRRRCRRPNDGTDPRTGMNVRRGKTRKEKLLPKIDEDVAQKKAKGARRTEDCCSVEVQRMKPCRDGPKCLCPIPVPYSMSLSMSLSTI
jgi:hypothetical protein